MKTLKRIVLTWLSTSEGGAEESVRVLSTAISNIYELEVYLIIWLFNDDIKFDNHVDTNAVIYICTDYQQYIEKVKVSLDAYPNETFLFTNHRTFYIDICEAKARDIKCAMVFRGIAINNESIRIIDVSSDNSLKSIKTDMIGWPQINKADAIIGISNSSASSLRSLIDQPDKIYRIYNGILDKWFISDSTKINVRKSVDNLLICSRLVSWKSIDVGILSFIRLLKEFPSIYMNIIGDGPEIDNLKSIVTSNGVQEKICFANWQDNPIDWYHKSDCLIHPSPIEGFGRVVAEANAAGLISIAPQSGGTGEIIINGHTGFTFEKDNVEDCYYAIKKLIKLDVITRQRMAKEAYLRTSVMCNAANMAEEYVGLANYILNG